MAAIEFDDPRFHFVMESTAPIDLLEPPWRRFHEALYQLTFTTIDPAHVEVAPTIEGRYSYLLTAHDDRTISAELDLVVRKRTTVTGFFSLAELVAHNPVIESVFEMLDASATSIEVTWI